MAIGQWEATWKKAKDGFKDLTGEDKPDVKKVLAILKKHKTSIASSLKLADEQYKAYEQGIRDLANGKTEDKKVDELLNRYGRTVKAARQAIASYDATLDTKIKGFKDKNLKTLYYRALKVMTRQLAVIDKELGLSQEELFGRLNLEREKKRRAEAGAAKMTAEEMLQVSTDPLLKKSTLTGVAKMRAFLKQCKALAQKESADPPAQAIAHFNQGIQKAARDLTQGLANIEKRKNVRLPRDVRNALQEGVSRNSGQYSVPGNIALRAYVAELKTLSTSAKTIEDWVQRNIR